MITLLKGLGEAAKQAESANNRLIIERIAPSIPAVDDMLNKNYTKDGPIPRDAQHAGRVMKNYRLTLMMVLCKK